MQLLFWIFDDTLFHITIINKKWRNIGCVYYFYERMLKIYLYVWIYINIEKLTEPLQGVIKNFK